jgi:hypothetical protein
MVVQEKKLEVIQKIEEKGMSIPQLAETVELNPTLLSLYLVKDSYPIPKRILDKVCAAVGV